MKTSRRFDTTNMKGNSQRDKLVMEHISQVEIIARKLKQKLPHNIELDDLISSGMVGLLTAVDRFDQNKGVKFKTYAEFRIRGAMIDELRDLDLLTRGKRQKMKDAEEKNYHCSHQVSSALSDQFGRVISFEDYVQNKKATLDQVLQSKKNCVLDKAIEGDNNLLLSKTIEELGEREGKILHMYYFEEQNLKQIGQTLGLCQARISQLHGEAKARLGELLSFNYNEENELIA